MKERGTGLSAPRSCRRWRAHMVEAIYSEISDERRQALDRHTESCAACRQELASLRAISRQVGHELLRPQPPIDVWQRLVPELDAHDSKPRLTFRYPAAAALAAAILAIGIGVGLLVRSPQPTGVTIAERTASESIAQDTRPAALEGSDLATPDLETEFVRFLERSTPLLLSVANRSADPTGVAVASLDAALERRAAERLAEEATSLATRLEADGRRRQAQLTSEIGTLFLQMSNLPSRDYQRGLEMVRATIEKRALLFQLSVEDMRRL